MGLTSASRGKRCSRDWQKLWMVMMRRPFGRSSTVSRPFRARSRSSAVGSRPSSPSRSADSASSGRIASLARSSCTRLAISAAPALV